MIEAVKVTVTTKAGVVTDLYFTASQWLNLVGGAIQNWDVGGVLWLRLEDIGNEDLVRQVEALIEKYPEGLDATKLVPVKPSAKDVAAKPESS